VEFNSCFLEWLAVSVKFFVFAAFVNQGKKAWDSQLASSHESEFIQTRFDKSGCQSVMVE
jgi:hypothetical protein